MSRLINLLAEARPLVMGILNVTPDSFSDGGEFLAQDRAIDRALQMLDEGADIIDVGGESTRPGAASVPESEELSRVVPLLETLRSQCNACLSVDTSTGSVITAASEAGCDLINDVRALTRPGALAAMADTELPVCLMHMQGEPETMQRDPSYEDLLAEVKSYLNNRIEVCIQSGIQRDRILVDPGFGFGKRPEHNLTLLNRLDEFSMLGPVLIGLSRKSTISKITGMEQRMTGSVAGALIAVQKGARIVRVHDVAETSAALAVLSATSAERLAEG